MKKVLRVLLCVVILALVIGDYEAHATLIKNNPIPKVIYDDVHQQYWLADMNMIKGTYSEQMNSLIPSLNDPVNGFTSPAYSDWHMANESEMEDLFWYYSGKELAEVFYPTFYTPEPIFHISGRINHAVTNDPVLQHTDLFLWVQVSQVGEIIDTVKLVEKVPEFIEYTAWVTASAVPVPEPASGVLWVSLLCWLVGYRRKIK